MIFKVAAPLLLVLFAAGGLLLLSSGGTMISAQGTQLMNGRRPFRFVGVNRFNLLTADRPELGQYRGCGTSWHDGDLAAWFAELKSLGVTAVRIWAFQRFTASGTDWRRFDKVLALARANGIRVIPVLENQWQDCTEGGYKSPQWYSSGYQHPYGSYPIAYRDYVSHVVSRYRGNPTILMWQMMNEAECIDAQALYSFTADVSGLIKSIDKNHLVSLGTIGTGQPGAQGSGEYRHLHSLPSIDILEYHDYDATQVFPSDGWNRLKERLEDAAALAKPLFVGEAGIRLGDYNADQRASILDAKMGAAFANGVDGYLIWHYRDNRQGTDPFEFGLADPLAAVVRRYANNAR